MLLIVYLVFEPILMNIVPLFVASQYYCVPYWPGIVIPAASRWQRRTPQMSQKAVQSTHSLWLYILRRRVYITENKQKVQSN